MNGTGIPEMHQLYRETKSQLENFRSAVAEGKSLRETVAFCRYLQWSGILKLCEVNFHDPNDGVTLKCDGAHLRWLTKEVEIQALEMMGGLGGVPPYVLCQFEKISHNLDLIAGFIAKTPQPPVLTVIEGGKTDAAG